MRWFITTILALTIGGADAQMFPPIGPGSLVPIGPSINSGSAPSPPVDAPAADLNFAANTVSGCVSFADCLTPTRAQAEIYTDASGNLSSIGANTAAIGSAGLQVYGAATNLLTQSQTFSTWTATNLTVATNATTAPDGTSTAASLTDSATNGLHRIVSPVLAFVSGTTYTWSVYLKANTNQYVQIYSSVVTVSNPYINVILSAGQGQTACALVNGDPANLPGAQAVSLANGWCRVSFSATATSSTSVAGMIIQTLVTPNSVRAATYAGTGTAVFAWGAQLEVGQQATPYIATAAAAVSRAADQIVAASTLKTCLEGAANRIVVTAGKANLNTGVYPQTIVGVGTLGTGLSLVAGNLLQTAWGTGTKATANQAASYTINNIGFSADGTGRAVALNGYSAASDANAPTVVSAENIGSLSDGTAPLNGNITRIRCWNTRNDAAMLTATANTNYIAPLAPYTGNIANGTNTPQSKSAATSCPGSTVCTQFQTRSVIKFTENAASFKVQWPNFFVATAVAGAETGSGTAGTISMQIEYPSGVCTRVTFSASNTATVPDNGTLISDTISLPVVAGTFGYVRTFGTGFTTGIVGGLNSILTSPTIDIPNGEGMQVANTGMTEINCGSAITQTNANWMTRPVAIIGTTINRTICDTGDSIAMGVFDSVLSDKNDYGGVVERPLGSYSPLNFISIAVGGDRANWVISNHAVRATLYPYCTQFISEYGVNDIIGAARSAPQVSADLTTLAGIYTAAVPGAHVFQTTITPDTTSTDSWATTVNQTDVSGNQNIITLNGLIRGGLSGFSGFFEIANNLTSGVDSGKWAVNGFANFCTGPSGAGLHPNTNCYMQILNSGAINPSLLNFVLKRDINPAANDNSPVFINQAA